VTTTRRAASRLHHEGRTVRTGGGADCAPETDDPAGTADAAGTDVEGADDVDDVGDGEGVDDVEGVDDGEGVDTAFSRRFGIRRTIIAKGPICGIGWEWRELADERIFFSPGD
jgi:hypothetical protein